MDQVIKVFSVRLRLHSLSNITAVPCTMLLYSTHLIQGQKPWYLKLMPPNFPSHVDEADNPHCVIRTLEVNRPKPVPVNRTLSVESPLVHDICINKGAVIIAGVCNKNHRHNFISAIDYMSGARVWEIRGMWEGI